MASDAFEVIPSEGSDAERSPAPSQGTAVRESEDPAEEPLLPESSGIAQSEDGWDQQSASQNSVPENTANGSETGSMIEDNETLWKTGSDSDESVQFENQECFPGEVIQQDYRMPDVISVRVQTGSDSFQDVAVKIQRPTFNKPFLGGFRNVSTGVEFHNAGSQTKPKKRPDKGIQLFCKETQTVVEKNKQQQTRNTASTQMTKIGLYVSNMTDKLITPGKYFTAEEYHERRLKAVIVLQKYFRRWHAINLVQNLKEQKRLRLALEAQEELRKKREKEDKLRREYEKKLNPKTKEDFELLFHELELWMQEETERINRTLSGAERKAALCALLEEETQLIACIGMHKLDANVENQQKTILHLLSKCAQPRRWKAYDGKITEMDTQKSLRGKELLEIYRSISTKDIPKDERISVLLTLKCTVKVVLEFQPHGFGLLCILIHNTILVQSLVYYLMSALRELCQEHECKLTQEIVALIDREFDLMSREVKECNLEGLRKRICTLFLQYIKIPEFNPGVAGLLKVPQDPLKLYKNVYICHSCEKYLAPAEFPIPANSHTIGRCRSCYQLDNEARKREAYFKYRLILEDLRKSEVDYQDDSKIVFLVQLPDLQYLIENIWNCQSALSACSDLYDLVMVRWDKQHEWSPWNTILLTKEEADAHLKLCNLQKTYEAPFLYRIEQKHIRAKNYFAQIPAMSSFLHRSNNQANANSHKKCSSSKLKT